MDRSDAITYLNGRFGAVIEALHVRPEDSPAGLGPSVDGAWLEMGVATAGETASSADRLAFALLRVHFLTHALERAAVLVDIQADDPQVRATRSQVFTQIQSALKQARIDADAAAEATLPDPTEMEVFRLNLDWTQDAPVV